MHKYVPTIPIPLLSDEPLLQTRRMLISVPYDINLQKSLITQIDILFKQTTIQTKHSVTL